MNGFNYLRTVRKSWDERFKMYMKLPKKDLASMLAERDKLDFPDGCKEFEADDNITTKCYTASTFTGNDK